MKKVLDLFSGIGGFSLGLERVRDKNGEQYFHTVAFSEIEKFPRKVLAKHWPNIPIYEDVRNVTKERLDADGITDIDVITGGFPCQDISLAAPVKDGYSRGKGLDGDRSGLWSECARILSEFRPIGIFENVTNLLNGERGDWFKRILWDLSKIGFDAEWHCIPSGAIGRPSYRDRIWIITYPREKRLQRLFKSNSIFTAEYDNQRFTLNSRNMYRHMGVSCIPEDIRMDDGLPNRSHRVRVLGNAVVPQIPEIIGREIYRQSNNGG